MGESIHLFSTSPPADEEEKKISVWPAFSGVYQTAQWYLEPLHALGMGQIFS